ncbi:MAG: hypothetical protein LAO03_11810 [Acidobacteriia bacterium]|nr:hypothetical protein [Terriglobia bacterium]
MARRGAKLSGIVILTAIFATPNLHSQLLSESRKATIQEGAAFRWKLQPELVQKLSRNVVAGPKISFPMLHGPDPKIAASARRNRQIVEQGTPSSPVEPGGRGPLLQQSTTLLSGSSAGDVGPRHVESAAAGGSISPNMAQPAQAKPNGTGSSMTKMGMAPRPLPCMRPVISDVNGANGVTTVIFLEPGKNYVIHGCGFGAVQGEAYLIGVKYQSSTSGSTRSPRSVLHPDWIKLVPALGADPHQKQAWTDTEIQLVVDPNASGFYDNYWSADVVVFPAGGKPKIQSIDGFGFWAARQEQTLPSLPLPASGSLNPKQPSPISMGSTAWFTPAQVSDSAGHFVAANLLSPSAASLVLPGHTFAVVRDDNSGTFAGRQDVLSLVPSLLNLAIGFQVSHIQLFNSSLSPSSCVMGSNFATSGNWNTASGGQDQVLVSWQEQSCGTNGISAYAIDITVAGPRGVSPQYAAASN